jgi:hypothetical protein
MNEPLPLVGPESPFAVLGIPPTLDLAAVKRAWFRALARHPPHQDPDGFRRLRAAYEALLRPGGLAMAFAASPIDAAAALAAFSDRFEARIARAAEDARRSGAGAEALARFIEVTSRLGFAEALAAYGFDITNAGSEVPGAPA